MLKTLLTGILSCSKKIYGAAVTCGVRLVSFVTSTIERTVNVLIEGWNWMGTALKKPTRMSSSSMHTPAQEDRPSGWSVVKTTLKHVLMQRFLLFLGGLICVFVLPPDVTNNDLTWFEGMLNSMKNMVAETCSTIRERAVASARGMFQQKAVT